MTHSGKLKPEMLDIPRDHTDLKDPKNRSWRDSCVRQTYNAIKHLTPAGQRILKAMFILAGQRGFVPFSRVDLLRQLGTKRLTNFSRHQVNLVDRLIKLGFVEAERVVNENVGCGWHYEYRMTRNTAYVLWHCYQKLKEDALPPEEKERLQRQREREAAEQRRKQQEAAYAAQEARRQAEEAARPIWVKAWEEITSTWYNIQSALFPKLRQRREAEMNELRRLADEFYRQR